MSFQLPSSDAAITQSLLTALATNTPFAIYAIGNNAMVDGRNFTQDGTHMNVVDLGDENAHKSLLGYKALQDAVNKNPMLCATTMEVTNGCDNSKPEAPKDNVITFDEENIVRLKQELSNLLRVFRITPNTVDLDVARISEHPLMSHLVILTNVHPHSMIQHGNPQVWVSLKNINNNVFINIETRTLFDYDYLQIQRLNILLGIHDFANLF